MELSQTSSKTHRIFGYLKRVARILLAISSALLFMSIVLLLVYGGECFSVHSHVGDIIWPTVIVTIYTLAYTVLIMVSFLVYQASQRTMSWTLIKKETLLVILTGLLMTIFYVVNANAISNYR